ncbi:MAG: hypothetical protein ACLGH7_08835, partial [Actinomycetes bacterium]
KRIVRNQYFPAGAVLAAVILFWLVGILGGLSLLHNNQPPLTTLTWMLFVYAAAVLTPLAGLLAAVDLLRRWRRDRAAAPAAEVAPAASVERVSPAAADAVTAAEPTVPAAAEPASPAAAAAPTPEQPKSAQQPKPRQPGRKAA